MRPELIDRWKKYKDNSVYVEIGRGLLEEKDP